MRHVYTNRVVVILATLLLAAAVLLAWSRSRPTAPAQFTAMRDAAARPRVEQTDEPIAVVDLAQLAAGQRIWESQCARCHRAAHSESVVPERLGKRARQLAGAREGRKELVRLLVRGTTSDSTANSRRHPTYTDLSDQDLQSLLNLMLFEDAPEDAEPSARPAAYALGEIARLRAPDAELPAEEESQLEKACSVENPSPEDHHVMGDGP